jgi:hypothetical protein
MSEMNVRSDAVDVEQIMRQIRARIREKRGADYTETELQQLANVKLEKFLDPRGLRSDLVAEYKRTRVVPPALTTYEFGERTLYETHRGLLSRIRSWLRPILKLFFNPDKITSAFHVQLQVNSQAEDRLRKLEEREPLSYELLHNITLEVTRLGIEVHNLKMRVESLSSRVDFDERRAKALESVVQYRTPAPTRPQPIQPAPAPTAMPSVASAPDGPAVTATPRPPDATGPDGAPAVNGDKRRRRRRRRRRPGGTLADAQGQNGSRSPGGSQEGGSDDSADDGPDGDGPDSSDAADQ